MATYSNSPGSWSSKKVGVYLFCICIGTCRMCGLDLSVAQILMYYGHIKCQQFLEQEASGSLPGRTPEGLQKHLSTSHHYNHTRSKYVVHGGSWDRCVTSTLFQWVSGTSHKSNTCLQSHLLYAPKPPPMHISIWFWT